MTKTKNVSVKIIQAFIDNGKGGNTAGVVFEADHLSSLEKQKVAMMMGLSEVAFVSKSTIADFKLDFFTPIRQIAHCGHATIAVFSYLSQIGIIKKRSTSKETIDGCKQVLLYGEDAFMEQSKPIYTEVDQDRVLRSLGLRKSDLIKALPIQKVHTGNSFIIVPVKDMDKLSSLEINFEEVTSLSNHFDVIGIYAFCLPEKESERHAISRMFAPAFGIPEESATGMAAGPLACYLWDNYVIRKQQILIEQGSLMSLPSPSLITIDLLIRDGEIESLLVGGKAHFKEEVIIEI
jgi:PhzF family phenazine biosynthesis protein